MAVKTGYNGPPAVPVINQATCISCGLCARVCHGQPLLFQNKKIYFDPNPGIGCVGCGHCMLICPTKSISVSGRDLTPGDLIEFPKQDKPATSQQLESLLLGRRSIREYLPREVDRETVDRIIQIASTAPMGIPPSDVGVVVFHGRQKVKALANDILRRYQKMLNLMTPFVFSILRATMKKQMSEFLESFVIPALKLFVESRKQGHDYLLYDAPLALLFHRSQYADPGDSYIAATYAMIAAEAMGLGTCLIGTVAPILSKNEPLKAKYNIPAENEPGILLIAGYPALKFKRAIKRRFSSVKFV